MPTIISTPITTTRPPPAGARARSSSGPGACCWAWRSPWSRLGGVGAAYQAVATELDRRAYPPTGQLIDVGGYRLHLQCVGQGSPTVVLESGLANPLSDLGLGPARRRRDDPRLRLRPRRRRLERPRPRPARRAPDRRASCTRC